MTVSVYFAIGAVAAGYIVYHLYVQLVSQAQAPRRPRAQQRWSSTITAITRLIHAYSWVVRVHYSILDFACARKPSTRVLGRFSTETSHPFNRQCERSRQPQPGHAPPRDPAPSAPRHLMLPSRS